MKCGEGCGLLHMVLENLLRWNPLYLYAYIPGRNSLRPFKHQVSLIAENAVRPVIRILVGDEVGLGKTIEAIMLLKILQARLERAGEKPRFLIIVPKILVDQWISELRRAGVTSIRVLETGGDVEDAAYRREPGCYVASLQLIRRREHADRITTIPWHAIVVDEAHNIGLGGAGLTLSYRLIYRLTRDPGRSVILLSATPHRGKPVDYIARLLLLIPGDVFDDLRQLRKIASLLDKTEFYTATHRSLLYRRTKETVNTLEGEEIFKPARLRAILVRAEDAERLFEETLINLLTRKLDEWGRDVWTEKNPKGLLIALLLKRAASSAYAARKTLKTILANLAERSRRAEGHDLEKLRALLSASFYDLEEDPDEAIEKALADLKGLFTERDAEELKKLEELASSIEEVGESKLRALKALVKNSVKSGKKVVVFTEYKDTLEYVYKELKNEYDGVYKISCISGSTLGECSKDRIEDVKQQLQAGGIDVLVATDIASEGLNLQAASVLINYDVPWSPLKLEQRIGRVWRIGQEGEVEVYNLFRDVQSERAIVDRLYMKILAIKRAMGAIESVLGADVKVYAEGSFESIDKLYEGGIAGVSGAVAEAFEEQGEVAIARAILEGEGMLDDIAAAIIRKINALKEEIRRKSVYPSTITVEEEYTLEGVGIPYLQGSLSTTLMKQSSRIAALLGHYNPRDLNTALMVFRSAVERLKRYSPGRIRRFIAKNIDGKLIIAPVVISKKHGFIVYEELVGLLVTGDRMEVLRGPKLLDLILDLVETGVKPAVTGEDRPVNLTKEQEYKIRGAVRKLVTRSFDRLKSLEEKIRDLSEIDASKPDVFIDKERLIIVESEGPEIRENAGGEWEGKGGSETSSYEDPKALERRLEIEREAIRLVKKYEESQGREAEDVHEGNPFDVISRDPLTGEVLRYIEVKSHSGYEASIELTSNEYEFAQAHKDKYWIYLVLGVGTSKPIIITILNPLARLPFKRVVKRVTREEIRYVARFTLSKEDFT